MIKPEMSESGAPKTLDYRAAYSESGPPSPLLAVFLCLPGLICWVALGEVILPVAFHFRIGMPGDPWELIGPFGLILVWTVAIMCAAASVGLYHSGPRPWYVRLNLAINISGLVFTGLVVFLILWHFAFR